MSNNNNFSNFKPQNSSVVGIQEWTQFLQLLNQKLNQLYQLIQQILTGTFSGSATMTAGTVAIQLAGIKTTSNVQAIMVIGGTQTGFLQVKCTLNTVTVTSTVNTDTGTILYSGAF